MIIFDPYNELNPELLKHLRRETLKKERELIKKYA